jgi:GNAT superfamily N-acetyltransferase
MRRGSLTIHSTDRADSEVFDRFFAGYDRAFVLPDEKEDREGLEECLALNHGPAHASLEARFGPFRELCLIADDANGRFVGGANFIAMPSPGALPAVVTANLNYVYVDAEARRRGFLRLLLEAAMASAGGLFGKGHGRPLVFIEQNDPFRMSAESYERDTRAAGIDQLDRLRIWARLGARVVDFPYVQPALSDGQEADDGLIYSVLGAQSPRLDAAVLHGHLQRFFGISVLKGRSLDADPAAAAQLERLERMMAESEPIRLLDPAPLLERVRSPTSPARSGTRSFREALSAIGQGLARGGSG